MGWILSLRILGSEMMIVLEGSLLLLGLLDEREEG